MARHYDGRLRAQRAAENEQRIIEVAGRHFATELFDRVTLASIAQEAGVTIPTLQRRFGNKEGLLHAFGEHLRTRIQGQRGEPPEGDIRAGLRQLLAHYEAEGAMVWHWLRQEADVAPLRKGLAEGRRVHRAWVERVFAHALRGRSGAARSAKVDQLVAVTDVFVWKLLRLDLGRPRPAVEAAMLDMALAVAEGEGT
jgi:AcrR family transcriptional regulator